ncbi:MAG: transglutaminase domain-containing protein [Rhodobacteraceae bacterium]|nr:transglutaminase domain-containing protein [Paracoccaceae bacterium]
MPANIVTVETPDCAGAHDAAALIAPLGVETEFQRLASFEAPKGWDVAIVAEERTGQLAAVMAPPTPDAKPRLQHTFSTGPGALPAQAFTPEGTPLASAASELAQDAREIAERAGGGLDGIAAVVADTSERFDYGAVPYEERWYHGADAVPQVACGVGNCIDINTYLIAALRASGYQTTYLTCYFFDDNPDGIASGMHCWVRTQCEGVTQDWDIAHFKKLGRSDVSATLNPAPGQRFALAYGRDHCYVWRGKSIELPTPSVPMWVREDGTAIKGEPPVVTLTAG